MSARHAHDAEAAAARRAEDRLFYAILMLVSGPVLQLGGWAAAFTDMGAIFVFTGTGMSLAGFLIRPSRWTFAGMLAGAALGGWGWFAAALLLR